MKLAGLVAKGFSPEVRRGSRVFFLSSNPSLTLDLIHPPSEWCEWFFCIGCVLFTGYRPLHIVHCCPFYGYDGVLSDFSVLA